MRALPAAPAARGVLPRVRRVSPDLAWAVFVGLNLAAMRLLPSWQTIPFLAIWVSLTVIYGFRLWRLQPTILTLTAVTLATGGIIGLQVLNHQQDADYLAEVPLIALMFLAMVWHGRRRLAAIQDKLTAMDQVQRISEENLRLLAQQRQFLQDASHELGTPITIALGHMELIETAATDQAIAKDARVVAGELGRLRTLANRLLLLASAEAPDFLRLAPVEVGSVVLDALDRWGPIPRRWRLGELADATVRADRDRLLAALDALLENAVAHTRTGDRIDVSVCLDDGHAVFAVADSGYGIPAADLDRIFGRFARASTSRDHDDGFGLGLPIAQAIAHAHSGSVRVRSSVGKGSTFEMLIPATPARLPLNCTQCQNSTERRKSEEWLVASTREWFETVEEARRRAERRLPKSVYLALVAGAEKGVTLRDNVSAFSELRFAPPRIADLPARRDMATSVLGQRISLPVIASPTGVQAVHPDGEVGVARGTAEAGTAMGLSSFASMPVEDVAAVNPKVFFQVYWSGDKDKILNRIERAGVAGSKALIVTLDWSFSNGRDWGSPLIPEKLDLRTLVRLAPEGLTRPRYVLDWLRHGGLPDLTVPNMAASGEPAPTFFGAYGEWMQTAPPTWADIAWLRAQWNGPFLVKGVMRPDDARRAVDAGATAVSVSNHGGNNLDGTPAAIRALPAVADAVGGQVEVLLDGGIRRGGDVVKALALGARAVMIGRAYLWGLAAGGPAGVRNVFDVLRGGIDATLLALGRASVRDVVPEDVIVPAGFTCEPGK
jgi:heme/flavin dehydrogenase (mycofactocin system)